MEHISGPTYLLLLILVGAVLYYENKYITAWRELERRKEQDLRRPGKAAD